VVVHSLTLQALDGRFAICRLAADALMPLWAMKDDFVSITRTPEELSIVCRQDAVPEGIACERGWRSLRVAGPIPFGVVGVLAALTAPLAEAKISIFTVSTFDTDYLLVKAEDFDAAVAALQRQGHTIR
jgi:hypothetical protein